MITKKRIVQNITKTIGQHEREIESNFINISVRSRKKLNEDICSITEEYRNKILTLLGKRVFRYIKEENEIMELIAKAINISRFSREGSVKSLRAILDKIVFDIKYTSSGLPRPDSRLRVKRMLRINATFESINYDSK